MSGTPDELDAAAVAELIAASWKYAAPFALDLSDESGIHLGEIAVALQAAFPLPPPSASPGGPSLTSGDLHLTAPVIVAALNESRIDGGIPVLQPRTSYSPRRGRFRLKTGVKRFSPATMTNAQLIVVAVILIAAVYPFLPAEVQADIQGETGLVAAVAAVLAVIKRSS